MLKSSLESDEESIGWINNFVERFWLLYEPGLSTTITASVNGILGNFTFPCVDWIRITTFTLGTKPPQLHRVRTNLVTEDGNTLSEHVAKSLWDVSFLPRDEPETRSAVARVRSKVTLEIRFAFGSFEFTQHVDLEDIGFEATAKIKLKLVNNFPHGFKPFLTTTLHEVLRPIFYFPNTFTVNLEQILAGEPIDSAIGVVALRIYSAHGLKTTKLGGGMPDPYVSVNISGRDEVARSSIKLRTDSPRWNETKYILVRDLHEVLRLNVLDWNEHRPDSDLGQATFPMRRLLEDARQEGIASEVIFNEKPRGVLTFDAIFFPVLKPAKLADGTEEPLPDSNAGVVRLTVHSAKDLESRGSKTHPYFLISLNLDDKVVHRSQTLKRTLNPVWERSIEFFVSDKTTAAFDVSVLDDAHDDDLLGKVRVPLADLLQPDARDERDRFCFTSSHLGSLRITAHWNPVQMAGAINGARAYTHPIGVVRFWFKRAQGLKNIEAKRASKSDPYARILSKGIILARTRVIDNDLDPEWDEILYITLHSPEDKYLIEVMDYEHSGKDRSLGIAEFVVNNLVAPSGNVSAPWVSTGKKSRTDSLRLPGRKSFKGSVDYEVEFFPCARLQNITFSEPVPDAIPGEGDEDEANSLVDHSVPSAAGLLRIPYAESGILAIHIISGSLSRAGARLEVLFDDGYWPSYASETSASRHAIWDEVGECFIRELDYSQIILRLNTAERETREHIVATRTIDMNAFLEATLDSPTEFVLSNRGELSTVKISTKYIPVEIKIEPRESITNSGWLRVELLDATGLPSADRNGKSDPYAVFELNRVKVAKSAVVRKTLAPQWNETFDIGVRSRVGSDFTITIFDWDRIGLAEPLGTGRIDVTSIEPFQQTPVLDIPLTPIRGRPGRKPGVVWIRMTFKSALLVRTRQATTNSGPEGRIGTHIRGASVDGGFDGILMVYKPDSQSTDEFIVIIADPAAAEKWIGGGTQGILSRPSKQELENVFPQTNVNDVIQVILQKGKLQSSDTPIKSADNKGYSA
ncbi:hypothetical protein RQP46_004183 [Phenoliferia psychrophenolica]